MLSHMFSSKYFTHTQENYLKINGNRSEYVQELANLVSSCEKKKLNRIVEEIKRMNPEFRNYLEKKCCGRLKIDEVKLFQRRYQIEKDRIQQSRQAKRDVIRLGFLMIAERLTDNKLNNFINQTRYLRETLKRDNDNLQRLGYSYEGLRSSMRLSNVMGDIFAQQRQNGKFNLLGSKLREHTATIHLATGYLTSITRN